MEALLEPLPHPVICLQRLATNGSILTARNLPAIRQLFAKERTYFVPPQTSALAVRAKRRHFWIRAYKSDSFELNTLRTMF